MGCYPTMDSWGRNMGARHANCALCNTQQEYSPPGEGTAIGRLTCYVEEMVMSADPLETHHLWRRRVSLAAALQNFAALWTTHRKLLVSNCSPLGNERAYGWKPPGPAGGTPALRSDLWEFLLAQERFFAFAEVTRGLADHFIQ